MSILVKVTASHLWKGKVTHKGQGQCKKYKENHKYHVTLLSKRRNLLEKNLYDLRINSN